VSALLESVLNQILQAQATEQLQAEPYERTDKRKVAVLVTLFCRAVL